MNKPRDGEDALPADAPAAASQEARQGGEGDQRQPDAEKHDAGLPKVGEFTIRHPKGIDERGAIQRRMPSTSMASDAGFHNAIDADAATDDAVDAAADGGVEEVGVMNHRTSIV